MNELTKVCGPNEIRQIGFLVEGFFTAVIHEKNCACTQSLPCSCNQRVAESYARELLALLKTLGLRFPALGEHL